MVSVGTTMSRRLERLGARGVWCTSGPHSGPGGAVINYAVHCCAASQEPVANLCASGLLEVMDEAFYKHRMWVSPELKEPPSCYYRRQDWIPQVSG